MRLWIRLIYTVCVYYMYSSLLLYTSATDFFTGRESRNEANRVATESPYQRFMWYDVAWTTSRRFLYERSLYEHVRGIVHKIRVYVYNSPSHLTSDI